MPASLPNFLIVGDLKAASTSLHRYLQQHPQIFMAEPKELRYFAFDPDNSYHVRARSMFVRTWPEYVSHFSDCGDAIAVGEASPNYLRSPGAAARINNALPDAKLIVSLRNPADRLYSCHQMDSRYSSSRVAFDERAFRDNASWIKGNFYWPDLKRYFDLFDKEQIMVLLFEDIVQQAVRVSQDVYRFLGVDDAFVPAIDVHNFGGVPKSRTAYSFLLGVKGAARRLIGRPEFIRKHWLTLKKASLKRVPMDGKLRQQILDVCRDDILRTQELIGRDLSRWLERAEPS